MLVATKVKMSGSEIKKLYRNTYNISSSIKRVTRKFLEISSSSRTKQGNVQKSVLQVKSRFLLLIRPIVVVF